jgi:excinuclease UvrABC nuclease subunit
MTSKFSDQAKANPNQDALLDADQPDSVQGQSIFHIQTAAAGVVVTTVFVTNDGQVLPLPAVFPTLAYGLEQIESLRQHVIDHFTHAAQVGAQVIAAQSANKEAEAKQETTSASDAVPEAGLLN